MSNILENLHSLYAQRRHSVWLWFDHKPWQMYGQPPAMAMQQLGWTPILFNPGDNPDSLVALARRNGAMGLKLYAQLDSLSVRRLCECFASR